MKRFLFCGFFILFISTFSWSASVVTGNNKEYAGEKIVFYRWSDPVTQNEIPVFSADFDADGRFRAEVNITATTFVFADFGIFRGMLFLEPATQNELLFPPKQEKSFADEKNPFFEPVSFWFHLAQDKGVNHDVSAFDTQYDQLTGKYFNQLYFRQSRPILDSVLTALAGMFEKPGDGAFDTHKKLKLKFLETEVLRQDTKDAAAVFSSVGITYWTHPAFVQAFSKVFDNRLSFDARGMEGTPLQKAIARADDVYLLEHINTVYGIEGHIAALALLKMIYDGWYSGDFPQEGLWKILTSDILAKNENRVIREISSLVSEKLKFLARGTDAPVICLKDADGNKKCSDVGNEKFRYIIFADDEMIVCREHLKYLPVIQEKFGKYLEIILVMRKTDLIEMKMFLDKRAIPGLKLVDQDGEYIRKYNVRSFPSCYLLDENHKVAMESAKAPLDGFEQQFGNFLQKELFERQREAK